MGAGERLADQAIPTAPAETADLLGTTVPAANPLLQRTRITMTGHRGHTSRAARALDATDRQVVQRFVEAWHRRDIDALARLLAEDAVLRMPPHGIMILDTAFGAITTITDFPDADLFPQFNLAIHRPATRQVGGLQ